MLSEAQRGHRYLELDSLRGLAAMAVVLGHFKGGLTDPSPRMFAAIAHVFGTGHAAVILFFLLSGFVLTVPYAGPAPPTFLAFLIKRICRIWLPYAAAICIAACFAAQLYSTVTTGNAWIDQTWSQPFATRLLVQHLLMIGHYDDVQFNTAIWSLIIEMRISIVFPAIAWLTGRFAPGVLALFFLPSTILVAYLADRSNHGLLCDTLFYSMIFVAGSLLNRHFTAARELCSSRNSLISVALLVAGLAAYQFSENIPAAVSIVPASFEVYFSDWLIALGGAIMLTLSITSLRLRRLLHTRAILWAGSRSYSIYLLHGTVLFALIRLNYMRRFSVLTLAFYLGAALCAAEIFHRVIEMPAIAAGRRFGRPRVQPATIPVKSQPFWTMDRIASFPES